MIALRLSELIVAIMSTGIAVFLFIWWSENRRRRKYDRELIASSVFCRICRLRYRYYGKSQESTCPHCQSANNFKNQKTVL